MRVSEVMTQGVECIGPDATLQEAAAKMKSLDVGPLPVCDNDRLVGMVTDRDITVRATAEGDAPTDVRVRDVMTPEVIYCFDDDLVEDAARLMAAKQVRRLVVLNRDKRMVGIVSLGDLAVKTGDEQLVGNALEGISEPNQPDRLKGTAPAARSRQGGLPQTSPFKDRTELSPGGFLMDRTAAVTALEEPVRVNAGQVTLEGDLGVPEGARGVVLFAHGSGSGRHSPRNRFVAQALQEAGLATLLVDLLTADEEAEDALTRHLRFDIGLLAGRLIGATDWLAKDVRTARLSVGYFGASTGGGAALVAAAQRPDRVAAVVSRGGRPDLAGEALAETHAPTLLIVGGDDEQVIGMNEEALARLAAPIKRLVIVPGASHLFEERGKLEQVAQLAAEWFTRHLGRLPGARVRPFIASIDGRLLP